MSAPRPQVLADGAIDRLKVPPSIKRAAHTAHTRARRIDERRAAARELDELLNPHGKVLPPPEDGPADGWCCSSFTFAEMRAAGHCGPNRCARRELEAALDLPGEAT